MFVIEVPFLNLNQIYESKQTLRWIKLRDSKYIVLDGNNSLKVEQKGDRLIMNCTDKEFYDMWFTYFDMETDYCEINNKMRCLGDSYIKEIAERSKGVRILNQYPYEVAVSRILLDGEKTETVIGYFCDLYGVKRVQSMGEVGKVTWREFPTPDRLVGRERDLRHDFQKGTVDNLIKYISDISLFDSCSVRTKDRVALYAFHDLSKVPIDKRVKKSIIEEYGFDADISDLMGKELKSVAGIFYQYVLYSYLIDKKEKGKTWAL